MNNTLTYFWKKIGKLKIRFQGNQSATLRFTPSKEAIQEGLARAQGCHKGRGSGKDNT